MRKPTIKSLKRKLDRLVSEIVRSEGYCVACRKDFPIDKLDTAHIISRKYNTLRFDFDNVLCLCDKCHGRFHDNPLLFADFCRNYLGGRKYGELKIRGNETKKWKIWELENLYKEMKND